MNELEENLYQVARDEASERTKIYSEYMMQESEEKSNLEVFRSLRPNLNRDGNMWCALYGANLQEGICGFGSSPMAAISDFNKEMNKEII